MIEKKMTPFEAIGEKTMDRLVDTFYGLVGQHPDLDELYSRLVLNAQHMINTPDDEVQQPGEKQ